MGDHVCRLARCVTCGSHTGSPGGGGIGSCCRRCTCSCMCTICCCCCCCCAIDSCSTRSASRRSWRARSLVCALKKYCASASKACEPSTRIDVLLALQRDVLTLSDMLYHVPYVDLWLSVRC